MTRTVLLTVLMIVCCCGTHAQTAVDGDSIFAQAEVVSDSIFTQIDAVSDSIRTKVTAVSDTSFSILPDTATTARKQKRDWTTWTPNPQRALWLALVIPGGGQIYNRKYWKLPIVYGGFLGCIYALTWNNMMYKDYSQAYIDIMDGNPETASYNKFLHLGRTINSTNIERYKSIFKSRKDKYRRWRDMSLFVMIGIYALSVIDAYVDAELSVFDISKDLSLKVAPTVIGNPMSENPVYASSFGVNCKLNF